MLSSVATVSASGDATSRRVAKAAIHSSAVTRRSCHEATVTAPFDRGSAEVASPELQIVNELIKATDMTSGSVDERRAAIESLAAPPADGTKVESVDAGGVPCEWVVAD